MWELGRQPIFLKGNGCPPPTHEQGILINVGLLLQISAPHVGYYDSCVNSTYINMCIYVFLTACGGVFNGTAGTISSPSHSITDYHHNINCTYHIYIRDNRVIDLK